MYTSVQKSSRTYVCKLFVVIATINEYKINFKLYMYMSLCQSKYLCCNKIKFDDIRMVFPKSNYMTKCS